MGYYINILQKNQLYELDGQKLRFIEKDGKRFYFHICEKDEWSFVYQPTGEIVSFLSNEINFIKRVQDEPNKGGLHKIGRERVFPRV